VIQIPAEQITDWSTFHDVFAAALGFPAFYGCNMNAWIDCLTYVDDPDAGMTKVMVGPGDVLTLQIDAFSAFAARCPEQYAALIECGAFVNWRRVVRGERAIPALAFYTEDALQTARPAVPQ